MFCLPCAAAPCEHAQIASPASAAPMLDLRLCISFYLGGLLGLVPPLRRRRCVGLGQRVQVSGRNLAFGTALQIVVEVLPILLNGGDGTKVRHALLRATVGDSGMEVVLRQSLE